MSLIHSEHTFLPPQERPRELARSQKTDSPGWSRPSKLTRARKASWCSLRVHVLLSLYISDEHIRLAHLERVLPRWLWTMVAASLFPCRVASWIENNTALERRGCWVVCCRGAAMSCNRRENLCFALVTQKWSKAFSKKDADVGPQPPPSNSARWGLLLSCGPAAIRDSRKGLLLRRVLEAT